MISKPPGLSFQCLLGLDWGPTYWLALPPSLKRWQTATFYEEVWTYMGVSKNRGGPPKWMVKIMENPIEMDDLGGKPTIFGNTPLNSQETLLEDHGGFFFKDSTGSLGISGLWHSFGHCDTLFDTEESKLQQAETKIQRHVMFITNKSTFMFS